MAANWLALPLKEDSFSVFSVIPILSFRNFWETSSFGSTEPESRGAFPPLGEATTMSALIMSCLMLPYVLILDKLSDEPYFPTSSA